MAEIKRNIPGALKIGENVIASIVSNSVKEIDGVHSILPAKKSIRQLFLNEENYGDIDIALNDGVVEISLKIVIKSGHKAISVAEEVQSEVKNAVQCMTGITVSRVNVVIADISFDQ